MLGCFVGVGEYSWTALGWVDDKDLALEPSVIRVVKSLEVLSQVGLLRAERLVENKEVLACLSVSSFDSQLAPGAVESSIDMKIAAEAWKKSLIVFVSNLEIFIGESLVIAIFEALNTLPVFDVHIWYITSSVSGCSAATTCLIAVIVLFLKIIMNALEALSIVVDGLHSRWQQGVERQQSCSDTQFIHFS